MAENKQEKRTFKYGDREYLLDDLLKLHGEQENNYYDFARNRGQYDDTALQGLRAAITSRIGAVKNGQSFDGDGVMEGDVVDNTSIKTQKKGLFKKEKYVDQDNTEWAKYYLNKLIGQLKPYEREEAKKSGWDVSKHGLSAYLTGQGLNAKEIFEGKDLRDENNPEAARAFTQRDELLRNYLGGYKTWLAGKGFDFTKNDNEWDDDFMTSLDSLINNKDWSDRMSVAASLRKLGAGEDYTTAFTSDKWDLSKSNDQIGEDAKKKAEELKAKEEREKYAKFAKDAYGTYSALSDNNLGGTYFTTKGDGLFALNDSEYEDWLNTHTNDKDVYMNALQTKYLKNPFDTQAASEYLPLAHRFGAIKEVDIDGKTWMYDPRTIDRKNNRVVIFDKDTGEMKHTFLGDIKEEWDSIKKKWRIDNGYEDPSEKYTSYNEEGGVLTLQTGGGFNLAQAVNRDLEERNRKRAKETGNSEEVQKARDRVVSNGDDSFTSEDPSIGSPDAGFTAAEKVRLGSIAADIGSIFLDPVTGVAVGLGSTLATFGADVMDDGFQWEDVKNLGINAGFDLVGAIPLFGDAVGTGAKITRKLVKYAPRVMAGLAAFQGVKNFDGMMESWGKFTSGDKDQKLTVQDWRNIAQSISLVAGGTRAIRGKAAQNKIKKQAKLDDVVGVNVRDQQGNIQQVLVNGETAKQVRAAQGDKKKIEEILGGLEDFKGKFGENGTLSVNTKSGSFQKPWEKVTNADGSTSRQMRGLRSEGRADVNDVYDFSRVPAGGVSSGFRIPGVSDKLNSWHQTTVKKLNELGAPTKVDKSGALTVAEVDAKVKALQDPVDATVEAMKQSMTKRTAGLNKLDSNIGVTKSSIKALQKKLKGVNKQQAQTELTGLAHTTKGMQSLELDVKNATRQVDSITQQLNAVNQKIATQQATGMNVTTRAEQMKSSLEAQLAAAQNNLTAKQAQLDALKPKAARRQQLQEQLADFDQLRQYQSRLRNLSTKKAQAATTNHTREYNKLTQMLADLQANHATVGGRSVNWDMAHILQQAGVTNAFNRGGSINRNKINKFLNYAKG